MGTLFRLNSNLLRPSAGTKVIKAAEYQQLMEANALLDHLLHSSGAGCGAGAEQGAVAHHHLHAA